MAQPETRRLAAIMFTDMAGFSRPMDADKARMLWLLETHNPDFYLSVGTSARSVILVIGVLLHVSSAFLRQITLNRLLQLRSDETEGSRRATVGDVSVASYEIQAIRQ